jgi:hypothetical protein
MILILIKINFDNNLKSYYLILTRNLNKLLKIIILNFYKKLVIVLIVLDLMKSNQTCIEVPGYCLKNNKKIKKIKNLLLIKKPIQYVFKIFELQQ